MWAISSPGKCLNGPGPSELQTHRAPWMSCKNLKIFTLESELIVYAQTSSSLWVLRLSTGITIYLIAG